MNVLLTGGAGFIGSHIADALLAEGHRVVVFDDLSTGRRENVPPDATFVEGDLRDGDAVDAVVRDHRPDAVCHQGAQTSVSVSTREPLRDAQINVLGTLHLLEACRTHGVGHVVFASTGGAIYGEVPEGTRAREDSSTHPLSPYACSKLAAEAYLGAYRQEHGLRSTVLRYGNVYGPRQDPHGEAGVVAIFARRLLAGEAVRINARRDVGDPGCVRDYVYVDDVVRANLRALRGELGASVLNVATGRGSTTAEVAHGLAAAGSIAPDVEHGPRRAGDLERSVLEPHPDLPPSVALEDGLARTLAAFRRG
ncbi:MAG: NAD-dependent epimerase/dehydratase family protein [Sandaracinaceae bacterium]